MNHIEARRTGRKCRVFGRGLMAGKGTSRWRDLTSSVQLKMIEMSSAATMEYGMTL